MFNHHFYPFLVKAIVLGIHHFKKPDVNVLHVFCSRMLEATGAVHRLSTEASEGQGGAAAERSPHFDHGCKCHWTGNPIQKLELSEFARKQFWNTQSPWYPLGLCYQLPWSNHRMARMKWGCAMKVRNTRQTLPGAKMPWVEEVGVGRVRNLKQLAQDS